MLSAEIIADRGYTPLQVEYYEAHRERQKRMLNAPKRLRISAIVAPPPRPERQADAHIWAYLIHYAPPPSKVKIGIIQAVVCGEYKITFAEMISPQRDQRVCIPRQIAMYLSCLLSGQSLPSTGRKFCGRDHTTIWHGRNKIRKIASLDLDFAAKVKALEEKCITAALFDLSPNG